MLPPVKFVAFALRVEIACAYADDSRVFFYCPSSSWMYPLPCPPAFIRNMCFLSQNAPFPSPIHPLYSCPRRAYKLLYTSFRLLSATTRFLPRDGKQTNTYLLNNKRISRALPSPYVVLCPYACCGMLNRVASFRESNLGLGAYWDLSELCM